MPRKKSATAKSLRAAPGRKTRVKKNNTRALAGNVWSIPRQIAFPDCLRTSLKYVIPLAQVLGGGTTNSLRFTTNAYDVDPALGSTAMAGFSELAIVYSRFRCLNIKYRFDCSNQEQFPLQMVYGVQTTSLSSTALGANYAENPYMHLSMLSDVRGGHSLRTFTGSIPLDKLFGTPQALFDDLFTGSTTSSTLSSTATAHCYIGSISAATPVAGWFVSGYIELDLVFMRRNGLIS